MTIRICAAALLASTAVGAWAQEQQQNQAADEQLAAECQEMLQYVQENDVEDTGMTAERAREIAQANEPQNCTDAQRVAQGEISETEGAENYDADAAARLLVAVPEPEVTVEQTAPDIQVEQRAPEVRVDPGQPTVTVEQAQPTVRVEMQPPRITIDMPKPRILVEMPDPTVDVEMQQPRVTVQQDDPQVSVEQGEPELRVDEQSIPAQQDGDQDQAQVQLESEEPVVELEQAGQADVQVSESRPNVRYNAAEPQIEVSEGGEPEISFNQPGEAEVEFRQMSAEETQQMADEARQQQASAEQQRGQQPAEQQAQAQPTEQQPEQDAAQDDRYAVMANRPDDETTGEAAGEVSSLSVQNLLDMTVIGADGDAIGDVEDVVFREGENYVIVSHGGFLGLGEQQIALPMSDMRISGDELVMPALTADEAENMEDVSASDFQRMEPDGQIEVMSQ